MTSLWRWLFGRDAREDERRALAAEAAVVKHAIARASDTELDRDQARIARARDAIALGKRLGDRRELFSTIDALLAHLLVLGASGAGKTFFVMRLLLLAAHEGTPVFVIDPKGELADLLLDRLLPGLLATLPPLEQHRLLSSIRVIDPFASNALPPLNPLVRDPSISIEVQAMDVGGSFDATVDAGSGVRMETLLDWVLRLVIEVGGSFLTVRRAFEELPVLEALVRLSNDRDVVRYFLNRWASEPASSKLAVLARLDRLLALPQTRLSLGASSCVDFDGALGSGVTVVNLGNAPAGLTEVASFWSTLIFTRLVRAIYRRPATGAGAKPAIVLIDEWQSCLTHPFASSMEDVLARARSRKVFMWLCNQQKSQIEKVSGALWDVVAGQTAIQVLFRATIEDARAMRHLLPVTGRLRRPAPLPWARATSPEPYLTPSEEIDARVAEVARLPTRVAYWWDRRRPHSAVQFRTADLVLPDPRQLPTALRDAVRVGAVAVPVAELERQRDAEGLRLDQLGRNASPPAPPSPGAPAPGSAPRVKPAPKRKRRKAGPGGLPW